MCHHYSSTGICNNALHSHSRLSLSIQEMNHHIIYSSIKIISLLTNSSTKHCVSILYFFNFYSSSLKVKPFAPLAVLSISMIFRATQRTSFHFQMSNSVHQPWCWSNSREWTQERSSEQRKIERSSENEREWTVGSNPRKANSPKIKRCSKEREHL